MIITEISLHVTDLNTSPFQLYNYDCSSGIYLPPLCREFAAFFMLMSNEGYGESVHMHRLATAIAARIHKTWMHMKTRPDQQTSNATVDTSVMAFINF